MSPTKKAFERLYIVKQFLKESILVGIIPKFIDIVIDI